ncbi:hypothetical protein ACFLTU_02675 [Bacteroidota bacterium]
MKSIISLILILFLALMSSGAQIPGVETIYRANDLIYYSDLESKSLQDFLNGNPDYLAMISAVNPNTTERELGLYRKWVDEIIVNIRDKKFDQLSEANKIERIKKYVRKALLVSYAHKAGFDELFRYGNYNYFTAAAIYALILDQFGIPYEIYELPTYIKIVAYPRDLNITFETASPGLQFYMFDHQTRSEFVEFIHGQGVIDDMTYKNTNTRNLFEQYYFAGYGLTIKEIIGMLYMYSAVDLMSQQRNIESYAQLEKAFILHPSYKAQYLLLSQLNSCLINMDYHNALDLGYLIKASHLIGFGVDRELIEQFLDDIIREVLIREEDQNAFDYIYDYLQQYMRDEDLRRTFTFQYLYQSGRLEFNDASYVRALDFLEPAYTIGREDEQCRNLLLRSLGGYSMVVSPARVLEKIQKYDTAFTEIKDEGIYQVVKSQTYLGIFGEAFQLRDGNMGEHYMLEFEKFQDANPETDINHILIGRSYSSAAIYYYREGMIKKSRQVLEKGLIYAPDNIELKLKLASFN